MVVRTLKVGLAKMMFRNYRVEIELTLETPKEMQPPSDLKDHRQPLRVTLFNWSCDNPRYTMSGMPAWEMLKPTSAFQGGGMKRAATPR
jgi:hypothetical protein